MSASCTSRAAWNGPVRPRRTSRRGVSKGKAILRGLERLEERTLLSASLVKDINLGVLASNPMELTPYDLSRARIVFRAK